MDKNLKPLTNQELAKVTGGGTSQEENGTQFKDECLKLKSKEECQSDEKCFWKKLPDWHPLDGMCFSI